MSVSIISNLPLRPCSRGQERGGCLFTCRWRPGVAVALLRCSRAIRPGSKCGGCWRRILFWSDCYLSTLPQLHPLCTSPPSTTRAVVIRRSDGYCSTMVLFLFYLYYFYLTPDLLSLASSSLSSLALSPAQHLYLAG